MSRHRLSVVLALLILAFASSTVSSQESAGQISAGLRIGVGYETETGLPWAVEPRLGLDLSWRSLYSYTEITQAFGRLDWRKELGYRLIDTASFGLGLSIFNKPRFALKAETLCKYRAYNDDMYETLLGAVMGLDVGSVRAPRGLFLRGALGYSMLLTDYSSDEMAFRDTGPILRLGICARPIKKMLLSFTMSDYTGSDVSIFGKTFFELGGAFDFGGPSIGASAMLKYTDFFTLTSDLDGYSLHLNARIPIHGNKRLEAPGLW
jgi:hypothetical protein